MSPSSLHKVHIKSAKTCDNWLVSDDSTGYNKYLSLSIFLTHVEANKGGGVALHLYCNCLVVYNVRAPYVFKKYEQLRPFDRG